MTAALRTGLLVLVASGLAPRAAAGDAPAVTLTGHEKWVTAVAFTPDGKRVVSGGEDETVRVWDAATGNELLTLRLKESVSAVAFAPDGKRVVAARGKTVEVWDVTK